MRLNATPLKAELVVAFLKKYEGRLIGDHGDGFGRRHRLFFDHGLKAWLRRIGVTAQTER